MQIEVNTADKNKGSQHDIVDVLKNNVQYVRSLMFYIKHTADSSFRFYIYKKIFSVTETHTQNMKYCRKKNLKSFTEIVQI